MVQIPPLGLTAFGPDFPFAFDDWLDHEAGLGSVPAHVMGAEVAIVGGGVAGMVAAYELMRLGLKPIIYEISRMGGRLRSVPFPKSPGVVAELGGMRFPLSGSSLWKYINMLGLQTRPFPNPLSETAGSTVVELAGEAHFARTMDDLPAIFHEVANAWETALENEANLGQIQAAMANRDAAEVHRLWDPIVKKWDDRTFYDFVATSPEFSSLSYRHREVFGQVGFGTGGWDSDFPNSMLEILRVVMAAFEDDQQYIVGGAEKIPRGIWAHEPDSLVGHPVGTSLAGLNGGVTRPGVTAIARGADGQFDVTDRWGRTSSFPVVLVTTQSWLMTTSIDVEESLFSHKVWMALDRTRYMPSSKTFVMVDRPFWNDIDPETGRPMMSMTLTDRNTRGTYLLDNGPDQPAVILLSYAWQSDAMKLLSMDASDRAELALDALAGIYPNTDIRSHIVGEPITVSWETDPDFLGAFKAAMPGHYRYNHRMYSHFMQADNPLDQQGIFIAGDDVSWTPGWAEGAVQTALNAVWGIVNHLGGASHPNNPGPGDVYAEFGPVALPDD